jgi:polyhydroxybutyrate depolymerase
MRRSSILALFAFAACSAPPPYVPSPLIEARGGYDAYVSRRYDGSRPFPLVVVLHGFGSTGFTADAYFGLSQLSDRRDFLVAYPDGTRGADGKSFWDAWDACCNRGNPPVDDVAYLNAVVDDMAARYRVDDKRVYLVGHSNGGYMAHRLACSSAARFAAIMSLAGSVDPDPSECAPADGIAVLQIHGDQDDAVLYADNARHPGARELVRRWAGHNGCAAQATAGESLDLDSAVAGAETLVERHGGCARGAAELWTMRGSGHVPLFHQPALSERITDWLFQFEKP